MKHYGHFFMDSEIFLKNTIKSSDKTSLLINKICCKHAKTTMAWCLYDKFIFKISRVLNWNFLIEIESLKYIFLSLHLLLWFYRICDTNRGTVSYHSKFRIIGKHQYIIRMDNFPKCLNISKKLATVVMGTVSTF